VQAFMNGTVSILKAVKKFKTQLSAGKIMESVFLDLYGVNNVDFLPHAGTINEQYYSYLLHNDVHQTIHKKTCGKLSKKINL
jgi:hypothetical protein